MSYDISQIQQLQSDISTLATNLSNLRTSKIDAVNAVEVNLGDIGIANGVLTLGAASPTDPNQAVTKAYVDALNGNTSQFAAVAVTGQYSDLLNKPTIPTNNNQLTNGADYATVAYVDGQIANVDFSDYSNTAQMEIAIDTSNTAMRVYVDAQVANVDFSDYSTTVEIANAISTSNSLMQTYVDGEISTAIANTQNYTDTAIADLVDSAPVTLDTLNEISAALGDDANFSNTIITALGYRLRVDTAAQGLTATQKSNALTNLGISGSTTFDGTFDGLSSKTSGTGEYSTSGNLTAGRGSGGVSLTTNDGYGNANITWNHKSGVPEQNGNAARIEVNTDSTSGASMYFELKSNVSSGTAVNLTNGMTLTEGNLDVNGTVTATGGNSTNWNTAYGWGNHASAGYLTSASTQSKYLRSDVDDQMLAQLSGGFGSVATSGTTNWNDSTNARSGGGYTLLLGTATNGPGGSYYYHPFSFEYSSKNGSGNMTQFAIPYNGTNLFFRYRYSNTWNAWTTVWTSGNFSSTDISNWDTAYSWGDHSTAGYAASGSLPTNYVRDDADDIKSGYLLFNKTGTATSTTNYPSSPIIMRASGWDTNNSVGKNVDWYIRAETLSSVYPEGDLVFYEESPTFAHEKLRLHGRGSGSSYQDPDAATFKGNVNILQTSDSSGGDLTVTGTVTATGGNSTNWNTAYGWGNHASAGYLTSAFIEDKGSYTSDLNSLTAASHEGYYSWGSTQPTNSPFSYAGVLVLRDNNQNNQLAFGNSSGRLALRRANSGSYGSWVEFWSTNHFSSTDISNWNTAYGWGDHASAGYQSAGNYVTTDTTQNITGIKEFQDDVDLRFGNGADFRMDWENANSRLMARVFTHGGYVRFQAENTAGTNRNVLSLSGDTGVTMYHDAAGECAGTKSTGMYSYGLDIAANSTSTIGTRANSLSVLTTGSNSPIACKVSTYDTVFSVLPWSNGLSYLASGIYYDGGTWVHASDNAYNCLLEISGTNGGRWFASSNSTGSWNLASALPLWNNSGQWVAGILNPNVSGTMDFGDVRIYADTHRAGLLAVANDTGTWSGVQIINGGYEHALMANGSGNVGLYNDNNNEWMIYCTDNEGVDLYYNGGLKLSTTNTGIDVTGGIVFDGGTLSGVLKVDEGQNGNIIYEKSGNGGYVPLLAQAINSGSTQTGAIKINFGISGRADMITGWIDIYNYTNGDTISIQLGGYLYEGAGQNEWVNESATIFTSNANNDWTIRFGHDGTNNCIWIGELNTTWNYSQITARDWTVGYTADVDQYDLEPSISYEASSFAYVDATRVGNLPHAKFSSLVNVTTMDSAWYNACAHDGSSGILQDTAVQIHGAGYLRAAYLNMTHASSTRNSDTVFFSSSDTYIRKNDADGFKTSLGLATVATSGSYNDLTNKPTIPTNNNQLTNGAGYITSTVSGSFTATGEVNAYSGAIDLRSDGIYFESGDHCITWNDGNGNFNIRVGNNPSETCTEAGYVFQDEWSQSQGWRQFNVSSASLSVGATPTWHTQIYYDYNYSSLRYQGSEKGYTYASGFRVTGNLLATSDVYAYYSDERLKEKTGKIENALDKLDAIETFYYTHNDKANELGYDGKDQQVGVSAQSVEAVMPEVVHLAPIDDDGEGNSISGENYKTVNYARLVPLLIESIKELRAEIEELKK